MKWLLKLFKSAPQENFDRGYRYVKKEWNKDPTPETARRLWIECDDSFNFNQFNIGMRTALLDLEIPNPF